MIEKEEELVQEEDEIVYDVAKNNRKLRQLRRFSVFSKSFDPECAEFLTDSATDFESVANKPFESSKFSQFDYANCVKKILSSIVLFKHLTSDDLDRIIECMFRRVCYPNELVIRQGDPGNYFYIIVKGIFDVYTKRCGQNELKVAELTDENYFGDLALLHNQPRSASVISRNEGILLCMNRDTFQQKAISISFDRRTRYTKLIESISFLRNSLSEIERSKVVDALESRFFDANALIFNENDKADGMYFIESGQVKITQMDTNGNRHEINVLEKGDYFGELALLRKSERTATALALSKCKLAFLDVDAFERLMGPCLNLIEKQKIDYYK